MDTSFITINTHSSIRIDAGPGAICYVDPFGFDTEPHDADLILFTHGHFDHFSPDDIAKVRKPHTTFVMPAPMMHDFIDAGFTHESAAFCAPWETIRPAGVQVEVTESYNIDKPYHPIDGWQHGYIITCADGTRVYVAGDTDDLPENHDLLCDVALVPVGGTYTMDAAEAAAFVNALRPKVAIPEHYGTIAGSPDDGARFAELVSPGIQVDIKL